jgi:lambda family phage tail tape measure protein
MAGDIVTQTTDTMKSTFSDLFQNVLKGQLNSAKDFFVSWGNFVLKIISDVIAQIITAKIISGIGSLFGVGTSVSSGAGALRMPSTSTFGGIATGFADGIESVPSTGMYKLHADEKVVPAYDAAHAGGKTTPISIINVITPEAVAAAMSGREGEGVIVNVIDRNSLRNGIVRREVKTR